MATTQTSKSSGSKSSSKSSSKAKSAGAAKAKTTDAIALLTQDHREVEKLFEQFEASKSDSPKQRLATQICMELRVHTQIEEEIFYPAAERALEEPDMVQEAIVEHQAAKNLIMEIEQMQAGDEFFDAKVKVLQEQIQHHVKEEEKELFPACKKTNMDMDGLGQRMAERKTELMGQLTDGRSRAH